MNAAYLAFRTSTEKMLENFKEERKIITDEVIYHHQRWWVEM